MAPADPTPDEKETTVASERPIVVGLGELLWDLFPGEGRASGRRPGGAPANVAFQAAQLGLHGVVASRVGDDADGRELVGYLDGRGVDVSLVQTEPPPGDGGRPTGTVTVHETADGPDYTIHTDVAWDRLAATDALGAVIARAAAVCCGSLAQRTDAGRDAIAALLARCGPNCRVVFDVNLRQAFYSEAVLRESCGRADVLKLNEAEVPVVGGLLGLPETVNEFADASLDALGLSLCCVTRGADGCRVAGDGVAEDVPSGRIDVADTVGAGDAFTAGLIYGLVHGWPARRCAAFANRVGGLVASRPGGMPDLRREFASLTEEFAGHSREECTV